MGLLTNKAHSVCYIIITFSYRVVSSLKIKDPDPLHPSNAHFAPSGTSIDGDLRQSTLQPKQLYQERFGGSPVKFILYSLCS